MEKKLEKTRKEPSNRHGDKQNTGETKTGKTVREEERFCGETMFKKHSCRKHVRICHSLCRKQREIKREREGEGEKKVEARNSEGKIQ